MAKPCVQDHTVEWSTAAATSDNLEAPDGGALDDSKIDLHAIALDNFGFYFKIASWRSMTFEFPFAILILDNAAFHYALSQCGNFP